jgi:transposase-like protein
MKTRERQAARELRREGESIKEIARCLGVSKSSVSLWVRDIELTSEQHAALQARNALHERQVRARRASAEKYRTLRRTYQGDGRLRAQANDPLYAAGCMLYWAEGDKCRNSVRMANSDSEVLRFFARFLRSCFGVENEAFRVSCNLFADHVARQREIENFWLGTLELPRACLRKSMVNRYSPASQRKRRNMLPYGTCKLAVHSTELLHTIYGSIQEYGGFERPEWLG